MRLEGGELWPVPWWLDAVCAASLSLLAILLGAPQVLGAATLLVAGLAWLLIASWRAPVLGRVWLLAAAVSVAALLGLAAPGGLPGAAGVALGSLALLLLLVATAVSVYRAGATSAP